MDAESRREVKAGDGWLLNWLRSSLSQRMSAGQRWRGRILVGWAGNLTVIRGYKRMPEAA